MQEFATGMLHWTLSATGLAHFVSALFLAWTATRFSPQGSAGRYLLAAFLIGAAASILGALEYERPRHAMAWSLWVYSVVVVYAAVLGFMVAGRKGKRPILLTASVLFACLVPLSWLSAIYIGCYVGHDCL
jgi:hypothetical protein